jgi:hypothetical protein
VTKMAQENVRGLNIPPDFIERVYQAIQDMEVDGIELWRPYITNALENDFKVIISGASIGCNNETCNHNSHDPASPYIKLIPREGRLIKLGEVQYGEVTDIFYALIKSDYTNYYCVQKEPYYHDQIFDMTANNVPDYLLARLGEAND